MTLDHLVLRTPHRSALLADIKSQFQLSTLEGFRDGAAGYSKGVRFGNGPFLDVFSWPKDKPSFSPLVALSGDLARAERIATRRGWSTKLHRRIDIPIMQRPPWSTLSFRRGQGLISSVFIIEYEEAPEAWRGDQYQGALYKRNAGGEANAELSELVVHGADIASGKFQLETLCEGGLPPIQFRLQSDYELGVNAIRIRKSEGTIVEWVPANFDSR